MTLLITGAGGFLGRRIVDRALASGRIDRLILADRDLSGLPRDPRITCVTGDLMAPEIRAVALDGADRVIHLAAMLGGAAEADPAEAFRQNVDLSVAIADHLRRTRPGARMVFASSIAVLGPDLPDPVTDATPRAPVMLYGAHKAMVETLLETYTRRDWIDAISLRPAGIVARDGVDAALKSAFLSQLFWALRRGEDITLPVSASARSWFASAQAVAGDVLHAALDDPGPVRSLTLPALSLTMSELIAALRRRYPESPSRVTFAPEPEAMTLFGAFPMLDTTTAEAAGYIGDADPDALVAAAMIQGGET